MIKEFLIDNYIWILVVILLTIVTIIGFLVDKNKNKKKEAEPTPQNPVPGPMLNPIPTGMNNGMPYNGQVMNQGPIQNPVPMMNNQPQNIPVQNNGVQMSEPYKNPVETPVLMPGVSQGNPEPVENISMNQVAEPMYQPLSEQTPHFPQQQMPNQPSSIPTPVNNPLPVQPVGMNYNQQMYPQMQPVNQMPNNGQPQMIPNPMGNNQMPSPMPNNGMNNTIPTPVNNQVNGMPSGYVYNPQNNNQM